MTSETGFTGNVSPKTGADKAAEKGPVVGRTSLTYRDHETLRRAKAAAGMLGMPMGDFVELAINEHARAEFKARGFDIDAFLAEEKAAA